jgi:capsular exopolysaccharide synthesis family protein
MTQYDLNLREYWRIIKKRRWIILFTVILTGSFSTLFALLNKPVPLYKSTASVRLERVMLSGGGIYQEAMPWTNPDLLTTQTAVIRSHGIVEQAAKKLGMIPANLTSEEVRANKEYLATVLNLRSLVDSDFEQQMGVINVHVKSADPRLAMRLANTLAEVYREERITDGNKRSVSQKGFIEAQLNQAREKLKASEEAAKAYREQNKLVSIDAESSGMVSKLQALQASYDKALVNAQKVAEIRRILDRAGATPLGSKTSFYLEDAPPTYKSFNEKLVQLMLERDTLLKTYTELYPQVAEIRRQMGEIIVTMKGQLAAFDTGLKEDIRDLKVKIDEVSGQVKMLPEKRLELSRLERQIQLNQELFNMLERKHQEAQITNAERVETVQIIRPALEPGAPANAPKIKETAFAGFLIGLILGIAFAFLIEMFDTSLGAIEEIESLMGVHVLGLIPHVSQQEIKETLKEKYAEDVDTEVAERAARLVSHFAPQSRLAESYRAIRTNLAFAGLDKDFKTIVVTSSSPEEGKTTSIINLAITMAQGGNRVLLIEGDLRKPMISRMFGMDYVPGLSDVLLGSYEWKKVVRTISDIMTGTLSTEDILQTPGIENLHILSSGTIPPNPAELIYSKAIGEFIGEVRAAYDYVLIDAPPLLAATDAALLAAKADAVVMVYRVGKIPRGVLKRAKAQLDNVKANVIGVILNGLKAELSSDYADYKYKYYYYFSKKTDSKPETPAEKIRAIPARVKALLGIAPEGLAGGEATEPRQPLSAGSIAARVRKLRRRRSPAGPRPEEKKISMVKASMLLIAVIFLAMGILYQMGILSFALPSLNAQKLQHRGASIHREGLASADNLNRVAAVAGHTAYRAKIRLAGQANPLPEISADQGGDAASLSAIAYAAPSARRE